MWMIMINAVFVCTYLIAIVSMVELIFFLIKRMTKKEWNQYIILGIGGIITAIVMANAYYLAHHVVETDYKVNTTKEIGTEQFRIVQISDSHLGSTMDGKKFSKYMQEINQLRPDIVVITGDYVDEYTSYGDMVEGTEGLGKLQTKYGVYFVYGNHEKKEGSQQNYQDKDLRNELQKNHVIILEDTVVEITDNIVLVGRQDSSMKDRAMASDLTKNIDKNKYIITLDHQPDDFEEEIKSQTDLVLSGHTHGGQLFPPGELRVLFGFINHLYGMEKRENTTFIVNAGISDCVLQFKMRTNSEYVVVDILKK